MSGKPIRSRMRAGILLALVAIAIARTSAADEFWPELDVWVPVSEASKLLFTTSGTRDRDTGDKSDADLGLYFDYRASQQISLRAGYVYSIGQPATPNESIEHRLVGDFTYHLQLKESLQLDDRTRLDLRKIDGDFSYRIHNRLRLQHSGPVLSHLLTEYIGFEAFYDDRSGSINRYRTEAGAVASISKSVEIELYVGRQRDSAPATHYTNGIGVTVNLYF